MFFSLPIQLASAIWVSRSTGADPQQTAAAIGIAVVGPLALIAARRFPGPVVAITAIAASLDLFVNERGGPPYVALAFAILGAIVRGARIWAWISIGVCWIGSITAATILGREEWTPFRIAGTTLGILIVFGIGEGIRTRRERAADFRRRLQERRQGAVQAERVRIARELHDVLAHSLSQINVQAGVGLHLMDKQPDKARDALASIKDTSKTALDEVRSVLGMLRAEGATIDAPLVPEPDLDRLANLVGSIPRAHGAPRRPPAARRGARAGAARDLPHRAGVAHQRRPSRGRGDERAGAARARRRGVPRRGSGMTGPGRAIVPPPNRAGAASSACASGPNCSAGISAPGRRPAAGSS